MFEPLIDVSIQYLVGLYNHSKIYYYKKSLFFTPSEFTDVFHQNFKKYKINRFFIENTFLPNLGGRYFLV